MIKKIRAHANAWQSSVDLEMDTQSHHKGSKQHKMLMQLKQRFGSKQWPCIRHYCFITSISQVLTLIIQQSMLHNTSSCTLWNTTGSRHISATRCVCARVCIKIASAQRSTKSKMNTLSALLATGTCMLKYAAFILEGSYLHPRCLV